MPSGSPLSHPAVVVNMKRRVLLEAFKYLSASDLLVRTVLVAKAWKEAAYSNEILLSFINSHEEDSNLTSLPLYKRVKQALKKSNYLLNVAEGSMQIWHLRNKAKEPIRSELFTISSRYVMISSSTALVTGGKGFERSCVSVDLKSREIRELPCMLNSHLFHGICRLKEGVYVSGGGLSPSTTALAERYEQGEWSPIASMTIPRYNHTLCAYLHRVYAFGGTNGFYVDSIEYYDGNTWQTAPMVLSSARNYCALLSIPTGLLLVGGCGPSIRKQYVHIWEETGQYWREIKEIRTEYTLSNAVTFRKAVLYIYSHKLNRYKVSLRLK